MYLEAQEPNARRSIDGFVGVQAGTHIGGVPTGGFDGSTQLCGQADGFPMGTPGCRRCLTLSPPDCPIFSGDSLVPCV